MGIRARDRSRTGWRAVLDPGMWFRSLLLTAVYVVLMSALLACVVGLARDTPEKGCFRREVTAHQGVPAP